MIAGLCCCMVATSAPLPAPDIFKNVKVPAKKKPAAKPSTTTTKKAASKPTKAKATKTPAKSSPVVTQSWEPEPDRYFDDEDTDSTAVATEVDIVKEAQPKVEEEKIFGPVEQAPMFPGGDAALFRYLAEHLRYPEDAQEQNIQGRVIVNLVITKTGEVGDVIVKRSVHPSLDKEAVRVCKSLPKFVPGRMNGQPVNVYYTLPITFKLQQ